MANNKQSYSVLSNISTDSLLRAVWSRFSMIIAAALVCIMMVSLYAQFIRKPVYTATMTYAVTSKRSSYFSTLNISAANEVAGVLTELIDSDLIESKIRASGGKLADFDGSITASQVTNANFINVTSSASSPEEAFLSLKALIEIFPTMSEYISDRSVIQVIRNPVVSTIPSNRMNVLKNQIVGAAMGAIAAAALICWDHTRREAIQTREGAKQLIDAEILGSICHENKKIGSRFSRKKRKKSVQIFDPTTSFAYTENIGAICSQLEHEASANGKKVFLITGVGENEGKSTVAANIASALALRKKNVALVDADLRNPSLNLFFDRIYNSPVPLNTLLSEQTITKESVFKCIHRHESLGLYMLFSREPDIRCTELLTSKNMEFLVHKLRAMDFVIIDSPPMSMFTDAEALAELSDASVLVVRRDNTPAADVNDAVDALRECKAAFLGVILNNIPITASTGTTHRYGYGYGRYGYGKSGYGKYGYGKYGYGKYGYKHNSSSGDSDETDDDPTAGSEIHSDRARKED